MGNPRPQYWTLERLQDVQAILRRISTPEVGTGLRSIDESGSLIDRVYDLYRETHPEATKSQVGQAINLFSKMGILDPGRPGTKRAGFKRTFDPKKVLTPNTIRRGFTKINVTWQPPAS